MFEIIQVLVSLSLDRFQQGGEALLILTAHEEQGMIKQLENKKVPIKKIEYIKLSIITRISFKFNAQSKQAILWWNKGRIPLGNRIA